MPHAGPQPLGGLSLTSTYSPHILLGCPFSSFLVPTVLHPTFHGGYLHSYCLLSLHA